MGSGTSMFNLFSNDMSCGSFQPIFGRSKHPKMQKMDSKNSMEGNTLSTNSRGGDGRRGSNSSFSEPKKVDQRPSPTMVTVVEKNTDELEHEEEEEERASDFEGYLFMRSPSLRDFCVPHSDDDSDDNFFNSGGNDKREGGIGDNKPQAKDSDFICNDEVCVRKVPSAPTTVKRVKRERRSTFSKVFAQKPGAMKNLLKPSAYHSGPQKFLANF